MQESEQFGGGSDVMGCAKTTLFKTGWPICNRAHFNSWSFLHWQFHKVNIMWDCTYLVY